MRLTEFKKSCWSHLDINQLNAGYNPKVTHECDSFHQNTWWIQTHTQCLSSCQTFYVIYVLTHSLLSITLGDRYFLFFLFSDDHTNMQSKNILPNASQLLSSRDQGVKLRDSDLSSCFLHHHESPPFNVLH